MIIDVDTHWEATGYAAGEHPLEPWLDQLPTSMEMLAFGIAGDLLGALSATPSGRRPRSCCRASSRMAQAAGWSGDPASAARRRPRPSASRGWTPSVSTTAS